MYMLRFDSIRCVFLLFYMLLFNMRENSDAIKLPKSFFGVLTPLSAVFQLYRLRVECTLFVIYKAWREPTRIGDRLV